MKTIWIITGIKTDEVGNMLTFGSRTFTWEHGRQLASQTVNGATWTYAYNSNGMRIGRTNGINTYEYVYNGSKLMQMTRNGVIIDFTYIDGIPATISFGGNTFYYVVNAQGDITGIADGQGNILITYYYDAWGSPYCTYNSATSPYAQSLYDLNPFRYRGYVYDWEVGLYYLQSRYYIPDVARFLNADGYTSTGQGFTGSNMFVYCLNNPANLHDKSGKSAAVAVTGGSLILAKIIAGAKALVGGLAVGLKYTAGIAVTGTMVLSLSGSSAKEEVIAEAATVSKSETQGGPYTVYYLCAQEDPTNTIIYVGRVKTANMSSRMAYHKTRGRRLVNQIDGLSYEACRGFEQAGMILYHTINRDNPQANQIRGISPRKPAKGLVYYSAAFNFSHQPTYAGESMMPASYWDNLTENEFLNAGM